MDTANAIDQMVGRRIKERRLALNFDQHTVAVSLAVAAEQIDHYEHGRARLSAPQLFALTRLLDVRASYFFQPFDEPIGLADLGFGTPMNR